MFDGSIELRALRFLIDALFVLVMTVIAFIDLDTKYILNKVTYPSIVLFYGLSLLLPERHWWDGLVGVAIGYGVPWLIGEIYMRVREKEGLGLGDGTMLATVGALLGWRGVVVSLFAGSVIGTLISIPALALRRKGREDEANLMQVEVPFGPYLAIGAVFYLFAEQWVLLHLRFLGG
jgi:leader peptidase (prepilin peptidase)/N-methyltransferase